jgi:hypothetical protein
MSERPTPLNGGVATCSICKEHNAYVLPLHGDKGGPLCCPLCIGQWHGEHGRRRRLGRIVIRAMAAYFEAGGKWSDTDTNLALWGRIPSGRLSARISTPSAI